MKTVTDYEKAGFKIQLDNSGRQMFNGCCIMKKPLEPAYVVLKLDADLERAEKVGVGFTFTEAKKLIKEMANDKV